MYAYTLARARARARKPFSASIRDKLGEYRNKRSLKEKADIAKKSCPTDAKAIIKCLAENNCNIIPFE